MKIVKRILKLLLILLLVLVISVVLILFIDNRKTDFLDIEKGSEFANNSYLITHVNIIPMTQDTVLRNKMVLIKKGVIHAISDTIDEKNVTVVDGENRYLSPGLMDMHVHVWDKYELGLYLANGVTTIRNLWGMPMHLRMKKEINNEEILAPTFLTAGPKLTGPNYLGDDNIQLQDPEEARGKVTAYKNRGYDFIKTYNGLTRELYDAILEQSKIDMMEIAAHPSAEVPYSYHFRPEIVSIEHTEDIVQQPLNFKLDTTKLDRVVETYGNTPNSSHSPTLTVYHDIYRMLVDDKVLTSDEVQFMNPLMQKTDSKGQFERWQNAKQKNNAIVAKIKKQHDFHLKIIGKLHRNNAKIVSSTDAGIGITVPGYAIHKEFAFYKEAGLSNYEILKTATVNASKVHKAMHNLGTVESGKQANLVLTLNNPLEDLATLKKPEMVFVKGRKLDREVLTTFESKAKNRTNLLATTIRYLEYLVVEK